MFVAVLFVYQDLLVFIRICLRYCLCVSAYFISRHNLKLYIFNQIRTLVEYLESKREVAESRQGTNRVSMPVTEQPS